MRNLDLLVLASGSKGNAAIVRNTSTGRGILIDCGICKRDFMSRCDELGFDPRNIEAIFISHEHTDHTKGLGVVLRGLEKSGARPLLYASQAVSGASGPIQEVCYGVGARGGAIVEHRAFRAGDAIGAAGMQVHVFPTSHDCSESFGFRVECEGDVLGWMTDTGVVTPQAHEALSGVRILGIESNHDVDMLRTGPYPWPLKQRVGGDFGHLSNDQCADELAGLLHSGLEQIACLHISENNNTYGLPKRGVQALLSAEDHPALVTSALQHGAIHLT